MRRCQKQLPTYDVLLDSGSDFTFNLSRLEVKGCIIKANLS